MSTYLKLTLIASFGTLVVGCAEHQHEKRLSSSRPNPQRLKHVRTTAYSRGEDGGRKNAIGQGLSSHKCKSAASDWSRFPLGTRFRIVGSNEEYIIDDYGTALIGTNTIDLYKPSKLEMRRWGVRHVDIDILEWGSETKSLQVLSPRAKHPTVKRMIVGLQKRGANKPQTPALD